MARALAHSPRHTAHLQSRHYLPSQAQHRQGAQTRHASSVVLRTDSTCFDSVHLICWHLYIFTLLQIADPHRTKRGNNAPPTHYDFFSLRLPPFVEKRVGAFRQKKYEYPPKKTRKILVDFKRNSYLCIVIERESALRITATQPNA